MKKTLLVGTMAIGLAVLPSSLVWAQAAPAQGSAVQASQAVQAPVREVHPHELMTFRERFDMWRAMRNARTMDEKMELWMQKRVELEKRAADQGVKLREMGPMMMSNGGSRENGRDNGRTWGGENRMGMMGQGGGGMHARPPMAP